MAYDDLVVLIPSHSLEDFPTELGDRDAGGLLNAFCVLWHPLLLARCSVIPSWHRADEPPEDLANKLIVVPSCCDDWLPGSWVEHARGEGAVVVAGLSDRDEMLAAVLESLETETDLDPDLEADFLALGTCHLMMELLTRHMHHFSSMDEAYLQREAVAAAEAALANDASAARTHLQACFDVLTETRERFYPVDCYLIDLCLLIPSLADEHLERTLSATKPVNLLASAADLQEISAQNPHMIERLREAWNRGDIDLIGGERTERPTPLLPLESVLWEFRKGHEIFRRLFNRTPTTWGRRRYGFATLLPQILSRHGYHSALHVALDDGIYPDAEQSKIRWEGCDGTVVDAMTRIPLAGDSAASYLRFPQRMAETMQEDQVAGLIFARWPEVKAPWFDDLRRIHAYSTTLGRFVCMDDFVQHTDDPGRLSAHEEHEYLSPFLVHAVAKREDNPISRYVDHFRRRMQLDVGGWHQAVATLLAGETLDAESDIPAEAVVEDAGPDVATLLAGETLDTESDISAEAVVEDAGPDGTSQAAAEADTCVDSFVTESSQQLADVVMAGAGSTSGYLLTNSLSGSRTVGIELPGPEPLLAMSESVKAVQNDSDRRRATVDVPGCGFTWIPAETSASPSAPQPTVPLAEENVLRNEFFEVHLNESTGGIRQLKGYGRTPNRISQQLGFRFPRERTITLGDGPEAERIKTAYSEMRCQSCEVISTGPAMGEILTTGELIDQQTDARLAGFRNTVRVWRGRPVVEVDIELEIDRMPDGDPWSNYFAARFAWNNSTASLTRSVLGGAHTFRGERFESPHYFEIADGDQRTTIVNFGLPFHRKTGPRMLDTLLVTAGETRRRFRFVIAVDQNYPLAAAADAMTPVTVTPTTTGPPPAGFSGWFFHVAQKNVQLTRVLPLTGLPDNAEPWEQDDHAELPPGNGFAVRLVETEGRARRVTLRCFRTPTSARQRDFHGRTLTTLAIEDDAVLIEMTAYEIADVELRFDDDRND